MTEQASCLLTPNFQAERRALTDVMALVMSYEIHHTYCEGGAELPKRPAKNGDCKMGIQIY